MKVLLITPLYPTEESPDSGAFIKRIHEIYDSLGYDVTLLSYERGGSKLNKIRDLFGFFRRIKKEISSSTYDVINVQYPFLASIPFYFTKHSAKLVTSVHGSDVEYNSFLKKLTAVFTENLLNKSDLIITPSEFFRDRLLQLLPLDPNVVVHCPPGGYDRSIFYQKEHTREKMWIGFAGRIVKEKGWRRILDAFEKITEDPKFDSVGLKLVGGGPEEVALNQRIQEMNMGDRIRYLHKLDQKEIGTFYRSLDIFVFPTELNESLGLVGIEAMASGAIVIASAIGGIMCYLKDGFNGFLFQAGDTEMLTKKLEEVLTLNDNEKRRIIENAKNSIKMYEKTEVARKIDNLLTSVL